jgi:hypothetical protein
MQAPMQAPMSMPYQQAPQQYQQQPMAPPDIRTHPREWFRYFDSNRTGRLDRGEVARAFAATFGASLDMNVLNAILGQLWPLFDRDGSGTVEEAEFLAPGGLCETIVAQLPRTVQYQQYQPQPQQMAAAPAPPSSVSMNCWSCRNAATVQPPPGEPAPRNFSVALNLTSHSTRFSYVCIFNRYPQFHRDVPVLQPAEPNQHITPRNYCVVDRFMVYFL